MRLCQRRVESLLQRMTDLPNHRWDLGAFENPGDWAAGLRDFVAVPGMLDFLRSLRRVGNALDEIVRRETNDAVVEEEPSEDEEPRPSALGGAFSTRPETQPSVVPAETTAEAPAKQASGCAAATEDQVEQVVVVHPVSRSLRPF